MREVYEVENVKCKRDTPMAVLVEIEGEDVWIPRSQLEEGNEIELEGDEGTIVMSQWIAEQKELV